PVVLYNVPGWRGGGIAAGVAIVDFNANVVAIQGVLLDHDPRGKGSSRAITGASEHEDPITPPSRARRRVPGDRVPLDRADAAVAKQNTVLSQCGDVAQTGHDVVRNGNAATSPHDHNAAIAV